MARGPRVSNETLLRAGLELMSRSGKSLTRLQSKGRSMLYRLPSSETVRVRTCNDHVLISLADSPEEGAHLNIEGTDWLLFVTPKEERTPGDVVAYLLPTKEVVGEVRRARKDWLKTANTKGANTTWNIWFSSDGPEKSSGYGQKWAQYRLPGTASTEQGDEPSSEPREERSGSVRVLVEAARHKIAAAAGVGEITGRHPTTQVTSFSRSRTRSAHTGRRDAQADLVSARSLWTMLCMNGG